MWIPTRAFLDAVMSAVSSGAGGDSINLGACSIGLFKAAIAPDVDTVMADLDEADYDGYARIAMGTMTDPFIGPGNLTLVGAGEKVFRPTGDTTPNTVYGQFLSGSSSATLFAVEVFDAPIALPTPAYAVTTVPRIGLDPTANYGLSMVSE